jgi:ArsR family transcriptional regulator, arsenate/arsenite/antimonite-responsive transcriptional repressor
LQTWLDLCQIRYMSNQTHGFVLRAAIGREPLGSMEAVEVAAMFKALSDPVRLRLLALIACHDGGEVCVCDLVDAFEVSPPTISHHLKVLREAGMIAADRRGTWIYYRLMPAALAYLAAVLAGTPAGTPSAV